MSLSTILEEIKTLQPITEQEVTRDPVQTFTAREGRKRNALDRIKQLKTEYTSELMGTALFILVTGSHKNEFVTSALEINSFTADPEAFYKDLASRISPTIYMNKITSSGMFDVIGRHLEDKAIELGIAGYPMLLFKDKYLKTITSQEDLASVIKQGINDQVGSEMVGINAVHTIFDQAIKANHKEKTTPILLSLDDETLALQLLKDLERLTSKVFLVVVGKASKQLKTVDGAIHSKDGSPESAKNVYLTIKSLIKK